MAIDMKKPRPRAVLVGVQLPNVSDVEHQSDMSELGGLVHTLGFDVVATVSQKRRAIVKGTVIGEGKLKEVARLTGGTGTVSSRAQAKRRKINEEDVVEEIAEGYEADDQNLEDEEIDDDDTEHSELAPGSADIVVFDCELTPNQLQNLEDATGVEVLDRTGVIVEIFHRHAKTREARIQVEIARLRYLSPRLRVSRHGGDRQGGGIGAKGAGESALELDKRRTRDRIAELTRELATVQSSQSERRQRRINQQTVALVGYTNAGKSSLMRALTGSEVLVENKLFATLDTTVRALYPESKPRILVSDTVGFIKKLPHDLVASFKSTLDEAASAALLLFVVDASDPTFRSQYQVTQDVLEEIDAKNSPSLLILNKIDCLNSQAIKALATEFPDAILLSTKNKDDIRQLREKVISHFEKGMTDVQIKVPYQESSLIGEIRKELRVLQETHDDIGTTFVVRGFENQIKKIRQKLKAGQ